MAYSDYVFCDELLNIFKDLWIFNVQMSESSFTAARALFLEPCLSVKVDRRD